MIDLLVVIDHESVWPLYEQLYDALRTAIVDGRLPGGSRLPSTRALAAELKVARNTVIAAFDQLRAEGYVSTRTGGGTRVRAIVPDRLLHAPAARRGAVRTTQEDSGPAPVLSHRGRDLVEASRLFPAGARPAEAFRIGMPALDEFPVGLWARLSAKRWKRPPSLGQGDAAGYAPLRDAIASYLATARGVRCTGEQVVITSGAQHGLDLLARLLLDAGDAVWMEDPGYPGARATFQAAGARLVPVPVDTEGLRVDEGYRRAAGARLAYVTPSHQFPLGGTMSAGRRLELLEWAAGAGSWIIEDDYDGEFRYMGRPLPSLQGMDPSGRVVYLGTFSKTVFPALRLGYLVLPDALIDPVASARAIADRHPPIVPQAVLADFLAEGHFVRHLRRMRRLYAERQEALVEIAREELADRVEILADGAGMHLVGWLAGGLSDTTAVARAARVGVRVEPLSEYAIETPRRQAILLGYTAMHVPQIRFGVRQLARVL